MDAKKLKEMKKFEVTGMSCAACVARVEKAVGKVEGVKSCSVSLLTNSMVVEGDVDSSKIVEAVVDAGYGSKSLDGAEKKSASPVSNADSLEDKETPVLIKRLCLSVGFLLLLMYFSMGRSMLSLPLPSFFDGNFVAIGLVQMLLSAIVLIINKKFFESGFKALFNRSPNMDSLVALGSGVSFVWSLVCLFLMTRTSMLGDKEATSKLLGNLYFESAAMILALITVGKTLEAKSKGRTTDALKSLMNLSPKTAVVLRDGKETELPVESVNVGDVFILKPGMQVPVDGLVLEGSSAVDESSI